jgi:predicted phage-related endonuclease
MSRVNLDDLRAQIELLRFVKDKKAELKEIEQTARAAIEAELGDCDEGTLDGHVVVTWKSHKRNALDQKLLQTMYPEVYENCKRVSEVRRFEIVDDVDDDRD